MSGVKRTVGSRELKTRLGTHLKRVRAGATLVITDRGHPVAELRPLDVSEDDLDGRLAELEALGIVTRGRSPGPLRPFRPITSRGRPLSEAVSEDREDRT
jgi:prevent-host-death family protein